MLIIRSAAAFPKMDVGRLGVVAISWVPFTHNGSGKLNGSANFILLLNSVLVTWELARHGETKVSAALNLQP